MRNLRKYSMQFFSYKNFILSFSLFSMQLLKPIKVINKSSDVIDVMYINWVGAGYQDRQFVQLLPDLHVDLKEIGEVYIYVGSNSHYHYPLNKNSIVEFNHKQTIIK